MDQVLVCLQQLRNPTHRLMFELMVRCGLRQIECRTFPVKYICNPAKRADLHGRRTVSVSMNPDEMKLKYDKPRSIDLPVDLMDDLWWYVVRRRRARAEANGQTTPSETVFLTEQGQPYGSTALTDIFAGIAKRVGFYVRPHMLRHTYATYMLWRLRASNFKGDPLMYVRDRLGHSSVATTMVYLHLVNTLEAQLVLQHEDEIDALFHAEAIR
jgi:integrase/recombinase XerD